MIDTVELTLEALKQPGDIFIRVQPQGVSLRFPDQKVVKALFGQPICLSFRFGWGGILRFNRVWIAEKVTDDLYRIEVRAA